MNESLMFECMFVLKNVDKEVIFIGCCTNEWQTDDFPPQQHK